MINWHALIPALIPALFTALLAVISVPVAAQTPLTIMAALDRQVAAPLLEAFSRSYPNIELHYQDRSSLQVDNYAKQAEPPPDIVISSAMPRQMALVNAGYAQPLHSFQAEAWPAWAKWRNAVFGFTFEPIVMAYTLELAKRMLPPYTHADLHQLLTSQPQLRGHITTYSPFGSGVGYALFQQDARYSPRFWGLVAAMGAADVKLENSTRAMLKGLSSGRYWLGYNLLGSYAMEWAQTHPNVIVQVPKDYALVLMRMVFIHKDALHPEAAKRFVNFLLGRQGQRILAGKTPLFSVLPDITGPYTAERLRDQVGDHLYPIPIDASLLAYVDPQRRKAFMDRWEREIRILKKQPGQHQQAP